MRLYLLAGNSISNKEWIEGVSESLSNMFYKREIWYYNHWDTGGDIDIDMEVSKFVVLVNSSSDEYIVFAKSIGSLVFLKSISKLKIKPSRVIILGYPYAIEGSIEQYVKGVDFNIHIYQKEFDPLGSFNQVKELETGSVVVTIYDSPDEENDSHRYRDLVYISALVGN